MQLVSDAKTEVVASIIKNKNTEEIKKILVVGCGSGLEAAVLSKELNADVIGIDIIDNFDELAAKRVTLKKGDATALDFSDETFDFIYSYHALEHINDPDKALSEMSRVLKKGGGYWIGTPNRTRLIGYIGSKGVSLKKKIAWNYLDWKARLAGKFRNEFGAHAGYSTVELHNMLLKAFPVAESVSKIYFSSVYAKHNFLLTCINLSGLSAFIYPSVYFYGYK